MLKNGLGEMICRHAQSAERIVDLFSGSGSVSWFASEHTGRPILAVDLQSYAVVLANAVIARDEALSSCDIAARWLDTVECVRRDSPFWKSAIGIDQLSEDIPTLVCEARQLCSAPSIIGPTWNAYGGHYFSPSQALTFDFMLQCMPASEPERSVCLAAILSAASKCVASPGHTAQPFQPTLTAGKFLLEAWKRNPLLVARKALDEICPRHANVTGKAIVADALIAASSLQSDDLVIVDPPYSGVHYSRFYHVLETLARGECEPVSGVGRYPPITDRPQSEFSNKGQSKRALERLVAALAAVNATVILTFPSGESSNGLSGDVVMQTARKWFSVEEKIINGRFSTLGGNNDYRASRKPSSELILLMRPK